MIGFKAAHEYRPESERRTFEICSEPEGRILYRELLVDRIGIGCWLTKNCGTAGGLEAGSGHAICATLPSLKSSFITSDICCDVVDCWIS